MGDREHETLTFEQGYLQCSSSSSEPMTDSFMQATASDYEDAVEVTLQGPN